MSHNNSMKIVNVGVAWYVLIISLIARLVRKSTRAIQCSLPLLRYFGDYSEISEGFKWIGRVEVSFQKSYAAVSIGVSSQRHSFRELARFLRSGGRRMFASAQTAVEHEPFIISPVKTVSRIRVSQQGAEV